MIKIKQNSVLSVVDKLSTTKLARLSEKYWNALGMVEFRHVGDNFISHNQQAKINKASRKRDKLKEQRRSDREFKKYIKSNGVYHDISVILRRHHLRVWQLCEVLGIKRFTYYNWHNDCTLPKHLPEINKAIKELLKSPKIIKSPNIEIKRKLRRYGLTTKLLCTALQVNRSTYYRWCHAKNYGGHREQIEKAINHLIKLLKKH